MHKGAEHSRLIKCYDVKNTRSCAMQKDTKTAETPNIATNGEVTQVFTPRTPLGKKLWELRKKHLTSGEPLLTLDEVRREVQARRGGIADEEDGA
jgi:hypothetical protein